MMRKRLFVMGIIVFLFGVFFSNNVLALNDSSSVYQKAWYAGVRTCYRATVSDGGLMSSVKLGEWDGAAANLFKEAGSDKRGKETVTVHTEGIVPIVAESNYKMACVVLLTERTAYKLPKGVVSSMEKKEEILSKIEYTRGVDGNDGADGDKCFSYKYIKSTKTSLTDYSDVEHFTPNLCIKKDDSGKYTAFVQELAGQYDTRINNDASNEVIQFIINGQNSLKVKIRIGNIDRDLYQNYKEKDYLLSNYGSEAEIFSDIGNFITSSIGSVRNVNDPILWDKQTVMGVNDATGEAESVTYTSYYYGACANYTPFTNGNGIECTSNNVYNGDFSDSTDNEVVYRKPSMRNSSDDSKVIEAFSNGAYDYEKIKFTDDEIYELYYYYLIEKYGATDIQCYSSEQYNAGEYQARLWTGSEYSKYCYFNVPKKNKDIRVWGVYDKSDTPALLFGKAIGIEELISQLNGLSNDSKPGTFNPSGSSSTNENTGDTECYDGSGPVGWLVCPLVKMISGIGESLWEYVKDSFMVIPTDFFSENGGVRAAWDAIRNIANIVFIILFMVVIFSQLTGVGIDNYGVKKILPKLIVVAVLVNVSWIICELVADISNIVGSGIENMLTGFAQSISPASPESDTGKIIAGSIGDVVLAGGAGYLFALLSGPGLIGAAALGFAVLGIVIALVMGVLTMYLILIIREAGIILMIVLAPVAIVCYALPNTEKYFKKWYELSKALIVVFPLCGAAIGAGRLASAVLASIAGGDASVAAVLGAINSGNIAEYTTRVFAAASANPGLMVAAIVVQVLPFFFIPKLLKNSLSLMGNIGAKLSSSGRRFSGGLTRKIQGRVGSSERVKRLQQFEQNKFNARKAEGIRKRFKGRDVNSLNDRQKAMLGWANQTAAGWETQGKRNESMADEMMGYDAEVKYGEAALANEREKKFSESFGKIEDRGKIETEFKNSLKGKDAEKTRAAFKELVARGGIEQALNAVSEEGVWEGMDSNVRSRLVQAMGGSNVDAFRAYSKYYGSGGRGSFKKWYRGDETQMAVDKKNGVKDKDLSYASRMLSRGLNSMVDLDKDELKFAQNNMPLVGKYGDESFNSATFSSMLAQAMVKSRDTDMQDTAATTLGNGIESGEMEIGNFGFTAGSLGSMRARDAERMIDSYSKRFNGDRERAKQEIRRQLNTQIETIKKDPRVLSGMNTTVMDMLGVNGNASSGTTSTASSGTTSTGTSGATSTTGGTPYRADMRVDYGSTPSYESAPEPNVQSDVAPADNSSQSGWYNTSAPEPVVDASSSDGRFDIPRANSNQSGWYNTSAPEPVATETPVIHKDQRANSGVVNRVSVRRVEAPTPRKNSESRVSRPPRVPPKNNNIT